MSSVVSRLMDTPFLPNRPLRPILEKKKSNSTWPTDLHSNHYDRSSTDRTHYKCLHCSTVSQVWLLPPLWSVLGRSVSSLLPFKTFGVTFLHQEKQGLSASVHLSTSRGWMWTFGQTLKMHVSAHCTCNPSIKTQKCLQTLLWSSPPPGVQQILYITPATVSLFMLSIS